MMGVIVVVSASFAKYKSRLKQRPSPAPAVTVVRDGKTLEISASDLVVGDVVKVNSGCVIEADGIVIESSGLKVDESAFTGESFPIPKDVFRDAQQIISPSLFRGSKVAEGSGAIVVIVIGTNTLQCRVMEVLEEASPVTSQQSALEELAGKFGVAGMLAAISIFLILLAYVICGAWSKGSWGMNGWYYLFTTFSITATITILVVPEGLPLVVALALAYSLERINTNVLIKRYEACEMSSEVTDLCADKTGTLTRNRMSVAEICTSERKYEEQQIEQLGTESIAHVLINSFCIGNDVEIVPSSVPGGPDEFRGSPTGCAMAETVKKWGIDFKDVQDRFPVLTRIPFNSVRKWGAAVASVKGENTIFLKGAVQRVISLCKYRNVKGQVEELQETEKRRLLDEVESKKAIRVLGVAYKVDHSSHVVNAELDESSVTQDLILLATVGFKDTLRAEVPSVLATLRRAGINCRMITGDESEAAVAIAKECGIIDDEESDGAVMNGQAFDQVCSDPQALQEACKKLRVIARATPAQKSIFVGELQKLGEKVAFVGDGVNDTLAIKKANVGFAMSLTGSELAKNAADVLLMNDDLIGIVTTLKWSRNMVHCIRKYAKFQIKSATTVLAVEFIGSLVLGHSPLSVIQLLWVYIFVDVLAPAAIVMKDPPNELLEHDSIPTRPLVTTAGKFQITVGVLYEVFCVISVLLLAPSVLGVSVSSYCIDWSEDCERHRTLIFHTLVLLQVCSLLCSQGPSAVKEICRCGPLTSVLVIALAVQFAMVQFGGAAMRCAQLTLQEHEFCLAIGLSSLLFCSLAKAD